MTTTPVVNRGAPADGPGANPRARTRLYRHGTCVLQDFPVADISDHLADPASVVWLDLCRPTPGDLDMVNTEFGLHETGLRGNWLVDLLLGGLNYQIEHHLFPSMPRASLRHARPIVRAHCLQHGLPYVETSLFDSYRQALHAVGRSGQPVRASEPAAVPDAHLVAAEGRHARQQKR